MELVGEALVSDLEFSSVVHPLVYLEGTESVNFRDLDSSSDQMLVSFSGTLFYWFRAWGLTTSDSLPSFLSSLSLCN